MNLAFHYKLLHVTPLRVKVWDGTKGDAGKHMKSEEGILYSRRRDRRKRKTTRRLRKKRRRYDAPSEGNKYNAILCCRNLLWCATDICSCYSVTLLHIRMTYWCQDGVYTSHYHSFNRICLSHYEFVIRFFTRNTERFKNKVLKIFNYTKIY
jgi:hypothetical protein